MMYVKIFTFDEGDNTQQHAPVTHPATEATVVLMIGEKLSRVGAKAGLESSMEYPTTSRWPFQHA